MKRLLFVILSLKCGGAERSLINLLNELPSSEYEVDLLLFRKTGEFLAQVPEYVHLLDTPEELEKLFGSVRKAGKMAPVKVLGTLLGRIFDGKAEKGRMMFRWKHFYAKVLTRLPGHYDVAVGYLEGESTYYICDFVNADKKITWVHNDYSALGHRAEDDIGYYRQMDAVVTISKECQEVLVKTFPDLKNRICLLENITSAAAIRRQAEGPVPEEVKPGVFTIVSVGRLAPQKSFETAVAAADLLKKAGAVFNWLIIGEGDQRRMLQEQIDSLGLQQEVQLLGIRTNPYPYLKNAALLVQTSKFEGKSIVVDEAKMLGVPVLLTRYATAKDQIHDGEEGWIVDMNPKAVADGILQVMHDPKCLLRVQDFLLAHDYDNVDELKKYEELFDS